MKTRKSKKRRVYPAESDPRQVVDPFASVIWPARHAMARLAMALSSEKLALAREFGPWVRAADGRWERDRRKR